MNYQHIDLTGEVGQRKSLFGKVIVTVEYRDPADGPGTWRKLWKDATLLDLAKIKLMQLEKA